MKNGGKLAILVIILVASVLGSFGWLWHAAHGQRVIEAWGSDSAMAIRHGTRVELFRVGGAPIEEGTPITVGDEQLWLSDKRDITGAHELNHYQRALADDYSYAWDAPGGECTPQWSQALRFDYQGDRTTLVFDFACLRVLNVEKGVPLHLEEKTARALQGFLARQGTGPPKPAAPPSQNDGE